MRFIFYAKDLARRRMFFRAKAKRQQRETPAQNSTSSKPQQTARSEGCGLRCTCGKRTPER